MKTLSEALAPSHLAPAAYATYAPYLKMTERFLGAQPSFYPLLAISPAAIRTHTGLFARMFHCPQVDMRLPGYPSPSVRRAAFLASSMKFDCSYCTAHAAAFGDLLLGPLAGRACPPPGQEDLGEAERAAADLAAAIATRPAPSRNVLIGEARKAEKILGPYGVEVVIAVSAFVGALNTVMDIQGVQLEPNVEKYAMSVLPGWEVGDYHAGLASEEAAKEKVGVVGNVLGLLGTMPAAMQGMAMESFEYYQGIPSKGDVLAWAEARVGPMPWLAQIRGGEVARAFCFALRENLVPDGKEVRMWDLSQRLRFIWVFGKTTGSEALCHAAGNIGKRKEALESWAEAADQDVSASEAAGRSLVVASATGMGSISPELVKEVAGACEAEAILELASLVSFLEMWRRMDLMFGLQY